MSTVQIFSSYIVAAIVFLILGIGFIKKLPTFDIFKEGAKEGIQTVIKLSTNVIGMFVAIQIFNDSGAMNLLVSIFRPIFSFFGIPAELMPLVAIRPVSGSTSLALVKDSMELFGPDSYLGRCAAVIMGSTETIFYTMTVYFGAVSIKKTRHTLGVSMASDFINIICGCFLVRKFMGG